MRLWPSQIGPRRLFGERESGKANRMSQTKLRGEHRTQEKGGDAPPQGQGKLNTVGDEAHSSQTLAMISEVALLSQPWNLTWHHLIIQVVVFLLMTNKPINYKTWLTANSIDLMKLDHVIEWNSSFTSSQSFNSLFYRQGNRELFILQTRKQKEKVHDFLNFHK